MLVSPVRAKPAVGVSANFASLSPPIEAGHNFNPESFGFFLLPPSRPICAESHVSPFPNVQFLDAYAGPVLNCRLGGVCPSARTGVSFLG